MDGKPTYRFADNLFTNAKLIVEEGFQLLELWKYIPVMCKIAKTRISITPSFIINWDRGANNHEDNHIYR